MKHIQKAKQKSNINSTSGITIISLTITIIVLIIISLITVNLTLGEEGIFNHANRAKTDYEIEAYMKEIEVARVEVGGKNQGIVTIDNLIERIEQKDIISGGTITKIDEETAKAITKEGYEIIITAKDTVHINGKIAIGTPTWNKSTHKASVTIRKGVGVDASLQIQYQVVTDLSNITESGWITGTSVNDLNHNDYVCARLWDGTKKEAQTHIQVKDNIAPTVTVNITRVSGNSITVSVNATDDQYGMETNPTYTFYIKKTNELNSSYVQKQSNTNSIYTFTELTQNTSYTIKVTAQDKAGNTGTGTKAGITGNVMTAKNGNLTISEPRWNATTHKASVTITKASEVDENLQIQYQVVTSLSNITEEGWKLGTSVENLNHDDYVCARFWNGSYGGEYTSIQVKDSIAPKLTINVDGISTRDIYVRANGTDDEYGMPIYPVYLFYIKKTSEPDSAYVKGENSSNVTGIFEELIQGTSYTIKAVGMDEAGNTGTTTKVVTTETVSGTIEIEEPTWNTSTYKASTNIKKVSVSNEALSIQYQVVKSLSNITEEGWRTGQNVGNLEHNDYVCARLWDGINAGEYISIRVHDTIPPAIRIYINGKNDFSYYLMTEAYDYESGFTGNIIFSMKKFSEPDSAYKSVSSSGGTCFITLEPDTTYIIKAMGFDVAGNLGEGTLIITTEARPTYTVEYDANGGSGIPQKQTKIYGYNLTLTSEKPARTGHIFQGWSKDSTSTTVDYAPGATYGEEANITLYAVWKKETYTIAYNANGGSGAPSQQTKTYGDNLTLSSVKPTRSNYTFLGWSTSSTATTAEYVSGATYSANKNTTLYAVWKRTYLDIYDAGTSKIGNFVGYAYTGFTNPEGWLTEPGIEETSSYVTIRGNINHYGSAFSSKKINLSEYSQAQITIVKNSIRHDADVKIGFTATCENNFNGTYKNLTTDTTISGPIKINISSLKGSYYFAVATKGESNIRIMKIRLIP